MSPSTSTGNSEEVPSGESYGQEPPFVDDSGSQDLADLSYVDEDANTFTGSKPTSGPGDA